MIPLLLALIPSLAAPAEPTNVYASLDAVALEYVRTGAETHTAMGATLAFFIVSHRTGEHVPAQSGLRWHLDQIARAYVDESSDGQLQMAFTLNERIAAHSKQ